ncbi:MAG: diguanylate cyclase [Alphaproteobacteria bacterium]|nr:diguanylate cyclase [Alphaproteobacteria bacterium]
MIDRARNLQRKARRRRFVGFSAMGALGLLFAAVMANAFTAAAQQRVAGQWRVHTLEVLLAISRTETAVNAALRGARGYLLTGDRVFLSPYARGRIESEAELGELRTLTRDNRVQQRNLADAAVRLHAYLDTVADEVALERRGRAGEAAAMVASGADRGRVEDVLAALSRAKAEELRLLAVRSAETEAAAKRGDRFNWLIAAVGAAMMALLAVALIGAARAHRRTLALTAALQRRATTDTLTGLANRRHLIATIDTEVRRARRTGRSLSFAILDIDHFKRINDTHGHAGGDAVLREIAAVLRETTRETDLLGRIGGEEFAVLMPETDTAQAERACERLRAAVAGRTISLAPGVETRVTISTGVALLSGEEAGDQLMARADRALYEAKAGGRNQVRMAA